MRYFDRLRTAQSVNKRYRELAKRHHPDVGGNLDVMKAINGQYREALSRIAASEARREAGESEAYQHMASAGKSQHGAKEGASFSRTANPKAQHTPKEADMETNLQNAQQSYISDAEKAAIGKMQNAATDFIRAGAQLFGEMAASWLDKKVNQNQG